MVNDLRIRRGIANLLNPHGMTGSEIVDAPYVSMSLERKSGTSIGYTDSIGWVRFDSFPNHSQTQTKNYGILSRNFKYSCTDCNVHVRLSYTDCGCVESATRMECDSDPVLQTNLGLTSLYSLLFLSQQESYQRIDYPLVRFLHIVFLS